MGTDIICYGDSNTYGFDPTDLFEGRYPDEKCWTNILSARTGIRFENYGFCGRMIPSGALLEHFLSQVKAWAKRKGRYELWIMLGTNDLLTGAKAKETSRRMEELTGAVCMTDEAACGSVSVRLLTPPLLKVGEWTNEECIGESAKLSGYYKKTAGKYGIAFTDTAPWDIPLIYDGVHFSVEGHRAFAEHMMDEVFKTY